MNGICFFKFTRNGCKHMLNEQQLVEIYVAKLALWAHSQNNAPGTNLNKMKGIDHGPKWSCLCHVLHHFQNDKRYLESPIMGLRN